MCVDPLTATLVGSALVSGAGTLLGGMSQVNAANYNAQVADVQRAETLGIAASKEADERRGGRRRMATVRASFAGRGVDPSSISALDLISDAARETELDALKIRNTGQLQAAGLARTAQNYRSEAKNAKVATYLGVAGDLLEPATKWASLQT